MSISRIGVSLKEGCCIDGAELAIQALEDNGIVFDFKLATKDDKTEFPNNLLHLNAIVDIVTKVKTEVKKARDAGKFPLIFGGDHSLSIGSISASSSADLAIIWVDAHGDSNTDQTTLTGRIHGMPLGVVSGFGARPLLEIVTPNFIKPSNIYLLATSDIDSQELVNINTWGINLFTLEDIRAVGIDKVISQVISMTKEQAVHFSFDLDSIHINKIKGVNTPASDGLNLKQAEIIIEEVLSNCNVVSMDIVEFNPLNDDGNTIKFIQELNNIVEKYKGE